MAGDWIKVEITLPDKPEVVQMAFTLGIDQDAVTGKLLRLWAWADQNTISGNSIPVTSSFLDRITACPGFADAMRKVAWLEGREGSLSFPRFDRHNGQTAKLRVETNRRVAKSRALKTDSPQGVAKSGNANVTKKTLQKPLPEKRREEIDTSGVPEVNTPTPFFDFEGLNPAIRTLRKPDGDMLTFEEDHLVWQHEFLKRWNKLPGVSKHAESCLGDFELRMLLERFQERDWNWQEAMAMFPINWPGSLSLVTFLERGKVQQIVGGKYKIPDFSNRVTVAKPKKDIFAGLRASEEKARNEESVFESS